MKKCQISWENRRERDTFVYNYYASEEREYRFIVK